MTLKKGDRVEYIHDGETRYGVVFRGGKNPTIYRDGGELTITGLAAAFRISKYPLPTDEPSAMDKWTIKSYKDSGFGDETPQFHAEIALNGKVVITASNHGTGGCNNYHPVNAVDGKYWDTIDQLKTDATEWGKQFGYPYDFEVEDTWVEWASREKIYGKKAVDYFKEYSGVINTANSGEFKLQ